MMKPIQIKNILPLLWMMLISGLATAQINPDDLLPVEQAFSLRASASGDAIELTFDIAPGYYLYRHAFRFEPATDGLRLEQARIPPGALTEDEFFGETETYRDHLMIALPVAGHAGGEALVDVRFQGCADLGVCYPPHRQTVEVRLPAVNLTTATSTGLDGLLGRPSTASGLMIESAGALPAEQAFRYEAIATNEATLLVRLTAAPDYYLYRDSISFRASDPDIQVEQTLLPEPVPIHDEFFGDTQAYYGEVEIPVYLSRPAGPARLLELVADFQGCLTDGICYPPMSRSVMLDLPAADGDIRQGSGTVNPDAAPVQESDAGRLQRLIAEQPLALTLGLFVLLGIGLAFTPCVFPMIPILSGIIAGEGEQVTRAKAFSLSLAYVLAMALTYTTVGVIAALAGYNLQAAFQNPWVLAAFAAIFVALALAMFGFYNLQMPASVQVKLTEISNRQSGGSLIGAAIMGFLSALIVGPCVTAPLIGVLGFIAMTGDAVLGGSVLFALSIGMGLPLLAIGVGLGSWLPRAGAWMDAIKAVFGVGLLALAIWLLERVLPGAVTMLLWGGLVIACGVYLGACNRTSPEQTGWQKFRQSLGIMFLVVGVIQFLGALSGGSDWTRPLNHWVGSGSQSVADARPAFSSVSSLDELKRSIETAPGAVFVDFYADWCVDCVRMERRTFPDAAVAQRMAAMTLIKVDVTAYNDDHKAILNHFNLIGPPAYLFFRNGEELSALRTFGFLPPTEFGDLLDQAIR